MHFTIFKIVEYFTYYIFADTKIKYVYETATRTLVCIIALMQFYKYFKMSTLENINSHFRSYANIIFASQFHREWYRQYYSNAKLIAYHILVF